MKTAIILASGPSLSIEQIDAARASKHRTIVVNSTYQKFLDADTLYAGDYLWWKIHHADVKAQFKGERVTGDSSVAARWPDVTRVRSAFREGLGREIIHQNGNSGVAALNLAYLQGFERIVLLGFDMKLGPNGEKHHHPDHPAPCVQGQTFGEWLHKLESVARDFKKTQCLVVNATPDSAMKCFPVADWREVLG